VRKGRREKAGIPREVQAIIFKTQHQSRTTALTSGRRAAQIAPRFLRQPSGASQSAPVGAVCGR